MLLSKFHFDTACMQFFTAWPTNLLHFPYHTSSDGAFGCPTTHCVHTDLLEYHLLSDKNCSGRVWTFIIGSKSEYSAIGPLRRIRKLKLKNIFSEKKVDIYLFLAVSHPEICANHCFSGEVWKLVLLAARGEYQPLGFHHTGQSHIQQLK